MFDQIAPGSEINVRIVRQPTNAAAAKTLERLLNKDDQVKTEHKRLEKVRQANLRTKQRGGRPWATRVPKQHPVKGRLGERGRLTATVDVLRDLGSVQRFVEITPA